MFTPKGIVFGGLVAGSLGVMALQATAQVGRGTPAPNPGAQQPGAQGGQSNPQGTQPTQQNNQQGIQPTQQNGQQPIQPISGGFRSPNAYSPGPGQFGQFGFNPSSGAGSLDPNQGQRQPGPNSFSNPNFNGFGNQNNGANGFNNANGFNGFNGGGFGFPFGGYGGNFGNAGMVIPSDAGINARWSMGPNNGVAQQAFLNQGQGQDDGGTGFGPPAPPQSGVALLDVRLPEQAELYLQGKKMNQTGPSRYLVTPVLSAGQSNVYRLKVVWSESGEDRSTSHTFTLFPGDHKSLTILGTSNAAAPMNSESEATEKK